ncbi:bacteriophage holin [bacterium]|nr:bacteriophage holin [bacterium]
MKLNIKAFALTCGLTCGFGLLLITLLLVYFEGASHQITFIGRIYRGYNISITGGLIGLIWGFFDGLIGGAIFAWIYNLFCGRSHSK